MLWGVRPLEHQAAYGVAVDRVRRQIHSGLLLPAEKLPSERKLSDEFGIARVTLREAFRVLETDNYINIKRGAHGGAFVTDMDNLIILSKRRLIREPATAMRVLEFLCVNERAAVGFASQRHGIPERKRMTYALDLMGQAESFPHLKQAETYFHLAFADAAHSSLLAKAIDDAHSELFLPFADVDLATQKQQTVKEHMELLHAIDAGDSHKAQVVIDSIHQQYWAHVRQLMRTAT